jgi:hypothetical protein
MDNLPDWVVSIIAVAVGLSPALALLMAPPIGRFLRRVLLERPEAAPQSRREPEGPAVVAPPGEAGRGELIPRHRPFTGSRSAERRGLRPRPFRFPSGDPAARNSIRHSGPQRVAWRNT